MYVSACHKDLICLRQIIHSLVTCAIVMAAMNFQGIYVRTEFGPVHLLMNIPCLNCHLLV